jgi:hypothetical protein
MAAEEYGPQIKDPLQGRMSALNIVFFSSRNDKNQCQLISIKQLYCLTVMKINNLQFI